MTNPLLEYFEQNKDRLIYKWVHYFDIYHRYFNKFRGRPVKMLEIGVYHGGSLQIWKDYFGSEANIVGIDIDPKCKNLAEPQISIEIGDQANLIFLNEVAEKYGPFDIVLDDGGHTMEQQKVSFQALYPHICSSGFYMCEDLHTSYWKEFSGGRNREGTFVEYCKALIDQLNAYHSREEGFIVDDFTKSTNSIHFYDSIVVIEKTIRSEPIALKTGFPSL